MDEGRLSKMKAFLVSRHSLAQIAHGLDLGAHLKLGRSAQGEGVQATDSILADALEAVLAAVHLDGGDAAARRVVGALFDRPLRHLDPEEAGHRDFKTALQEHLQAEGRRTPAYRVGRTEGPPHRPVFHVDVLVEDAVLAHGQGRSKKEAEQSAAREAMRALSAPRAKPSPPRERPPSPKRSR